MMLAQGACYPAVRKTSSFVDYCLPQTLYHGTSRQCLQAIRLEGLRADIPTKQSMASGSAVYLISDIGMAAHMARLRAFRNKDEPVVLAISARALNADQIHFDLNMSHRYWSQSIAYAGVISPESILELPASDALRTDDHMILGDAVPGHHPLTFDMGWERASEFLRYAALSEE